MTKTHCVTYLNIKSDFRKVAEIVTLSLSEDSEETNTKPTMKIQPDRRRGRFGGNENCGN